jgi:carbonic anhydrase
MTGTDDLLDRNRAYAGGHTGADLPARPRLRVAVLTCMDARVVPARALGLTEGDAHVIRNAGGLATDDAVRSLVLSQRLLGTEEVLVVHHTRCGMEGLREEELLSTLEDETGRRPGFDLGGFEDVEEDVRRTVARLRDEPFLLHRRVRGFVYEVETGRLREVAAEG